MDKHTREAIEACRPGSNDLSGAELADVARAVESDPQARAFYHRVQQSDAAIKLAMGCVSVPEGLAARLLASLAASRNDQRQLNAQPLEAPALTAAAVSATGLVDVKMDASQLRRARRRWFGACAAIAGTIVVAACLSTYLAGKSPSTLEDLATGWAEQLGVEWQDVERVPREFSVPAAIVAPPISWQWIARQSGAGVAYQLRTATGQKAMLFVVRMSRPELSTAPPDHPQSTTLGRAVGYWRSGKLVYVLVVPGDERSYRAFVNSSAAPLA